MDTLPFFTSHYSIGSSILTLDKPGDVEENGPESILKICQDNNLKDLYLCDNNMSGFVSAYKGADYCKLNLHYGLKLVLCNDMLDKTPESVNSESKIIIWIRNSQGYKDLIKIYSMAATEGFYYRPRIDSAILSEHWNENNLMLSIPYYYSFIHRNMLYGSSCRPNFSFTKPFVEQEENDLPFNFLIDDGIKNYVKQSKSDIIKSKSIYYKYEKDFLYYLAYKCMNERTTLDKPNIDHLGSNQFSFESWQKLQ